MTKCEAEGRCRVCGSHGDIQAAHTLGRVHDPLDGRVRAVDIVPLCTLDHLAYDARRLNILPHLSKAEQAAAVEHVGIDRALRRLTSGQCRIEETVDA